MARLETDPLNQLALFEGPHVPRRAAREALLRGDFDTARARLAGLADAPEEAADAARLERIAAALGGASDPAVAAHDAFASALAAGGAPGFLADADWARAYARRLAEALAGAPGRRFRGWGGAHFAFALATADRGGKEADAARRAAEQLAETQAAGPSWLEAARLAFALGEPVRAQGWIHAACLASPVDLVPEPPALEPCGVPALDALPPLPALPAPVEDAFDAARTLEGLPGPRWRWVAVIGEIDRALVPASEATEGDRRSAGVSDDRNAAGVEGVGAADDADPPRAFLAALRAARRSRERDRHRSPERCSDRELRARRRMQRIAPALLERYLRSLRGELF